MNHHWRLIFGSGEDAPGKSLDEIFWCEKCGCVKHEYHHNGGHSPSVFPNYFAIGDIFFSSEEPECKERRL